MRKLALLAVLASCAYAPPLPRDVEPGGQPENGALPRREPKKIARTDSPKLDAAAAAPAVVASDVTLESLRAPAPPARSSLAVKPAAQRGARGARGDVSEIYKKVAPAVVLIQTANGFGTGVLIQSPVPGIVLTNHHVVADGEREDLRVKVTVQVGKLNAFGGMDEDKSYDAYVLKWDPVLDLAVLRIKDAPADLPTVKISAIDPRPGEEVASIGHGGIGMLWAIKDGNVDGIGKLASHLARVVGFQCAKTSSDAATAMRCQKYDAMKKELEQERPALVIQSSCVISPGDSGGPLVNKAGELVGLNDFVQWDEKVPVSSNFHVHVAEIREFLKGDLPADGATMVPDPWKDGGSLAQLADADLDGYADTLVLADLGRATIFVDADQDSFKGKDKVPAVADVVKSRAFDAEFAMVTGAEHAYAFYDTDNDGKWDRLLVANGPGEEATAAYTAPDGVTWTRDAAAGPQKLVQPALFAGKLAQRFAAVAAGLFPPAQIAQLPGAIAPLPDPVWGGGRDGRIVDLDRDGKPDAVVTHGGFASAVLVDPAEATLGLQKEGDARELIEKRAVGARFSAVRAGQRTWAFYDTAGKGHFDLALFSPRPAGAATAAWRLDESGKPLADAPEFVGRALVRPALVDGHDPAAAARVLLANASIGAFAAVNDGVGSFPNPLRAGYEVLDAGAPGWEDAAVSIAGGGGEAVLVDLDRDTFPKKGRHPAPADPRAVEQAVLSGRFKAELGWVSQGGLEWAYYDTDHDGRWDVVLFTSNPGSGESERAWRIGKDGAVTAAPTLAAGKLFRARLFDRKLQPAFRQVMPKLFVPKAIEE